MPQLVHRRVRVECRVIVEDMAGDILLDITMVGNRRDDGTVSGMKTAVERAAGEAYDGAERLVSAYGRFRNSKGDA